MPVVSVRDKNDPKLTNDRIMEILHNATGVFFTGFRKNQRGYAAYLENYADKEKLLDPANRAVIARDGIEVIKPPDYRAACTIIINRGANLLRSIGEERIKKELEDSIGSEISGLSVFGDRLRVELNSPEVANRILEAGTVETETTVFHDIEKQRFSKVPQCSRCYSYAHERVDCPSREQLCFICAEPGHDDITCPNKENPNCRNCHQDHVAIAFKCPFRKVRLFELEQRSDCDLETLILVDQMRRIHGEKNPLSSDDGSSEGRSEDTVEGAAAESDASGERGASALLIYETLVRDTVNKLKERMEKAMNNKDDEEKPWKTVRILKAPDPENGEGPNRRCRKIPNFKPPVIEPSAPLTFPRLPPRPLRKIAA